MLTSDNKTLNNLAKNLIQAIQATNNAVNNDLDYEDIEKLEDIEEAHQNKFIKYIHSMLPKSLLTSLKEEKKIRLYNAKIIDKYIHSKVEV